MLHLVATAEYPATIVQDSTHIFKERDMCRKKLTQVAGYSAVKPTFIASIKINRNKHILGYLFINSLAILLFWFHVNDKAKSDNELLVRISMFAFFISWLIAYCFAAHEEFKA